MTAIDVLAGSYDNSDAAYALEIPSFADFRKNGERSGFFHLPRYDENPVRPRFRIAHLYEYALFAELSRHMNKDRASRIVLGRLIDMVDEFLPRLNVLDWEVRQAIMHYEPRGEDRVHDKSDVKRVERHGLGYIVNFPKYAFDQKFVDRSDAAQADPLCWVVGADITHWGDGYEGFGVLVADGSRPASEIFVQLNKENPRHRDYIPDNQSMVVVNVTSLLTRVDRRLAIRLRGRVLSGE